MTTNQPNRPWVIAGGITFSCFEFIGIIYALAAGRVQFTQKFAVFAILITVVMGLPGLLIGLIFTKIRRFFGSLNIYVQGMVFMVLLGAVMGLFAKGPSWFNSTDFLVANIMSALSGLLFVRLGIQFETSK
jgi:hypothetical protein